MLNWYWKKHNIILGIKLNISSKLYLSKGMFHSRHNAPCLSYVYTVSKENKFRHTVLYYLIKTVFLCLLKRFAKTCLYSNTFVPVVILL